MRDRKITILTAVTTAWLTAVGILGVLGTPKGVWPYAAAHAPLFIVTLAAIWGLPPLCGFIWLLSGPVATEGPLAPFIRRFVKQPRPTPPDRAKWANRLTVVVLLFMVVGQAWQTIGLMLLWHGRQLPWEVAVRHGPHYWGLPDTHHLLVRGWPAVTCLLLVWFGNGLPKLMSPFRGSHEPYEWGKMMRACGWSFTVGGLAGAGVVLFTPDLRTALGGCGLIVMMSTAVAVATWAIYRVSGPGRATPPEGAS